MAINLPIVSKFDSKGVDQADSALSKLGGVASGIGAAAAAGLAVASAAAVAFGVSALKAAADADHITKNMENAAKNAGLYGSTAAEIDKVTSALDKHSTKLAEATGVDDEYINGLKTAWLAVPAIAGMGIDGINRLATISLDIAASAGKDAEGVATSIAKAFENPESALMKLQKAGVFLTDQQNEMYTQLVETGQAAEAQGYLVDTLGEKYKGAAEAAANPFKRLEVIFENLKETVGGAMLPAIEKLVPIVADFVTKLTASPEFQTFLEALSVAFNALLEALLPLLPVFFDMITALLPPLVEVITLLAPLVADVVEAFAPLIPIIADLALTLLPPLVELIKNLVGILIENPEFMDSMIQGFQDMHKIVEPVAGFLGMIADFLGQIGNKKTVLDGLEARVRSAAVATNPFSLKQSSWMASGGTLNIGKIPGQAAGGITARAGLSWVGEKGPELLNLPTGAQVIPLDRMGGGATYNITVNAGMGSDGASLGEQIVTAIRKYERTSGAVFARA